MAEGMMRSIHFHAILGSEMQVRIGDTKGFKRMAFVTGCGLLFSDSRRAEYRVWLTSRQSGADDRNVKRGKVELRLRHNGEHLSQLLDSCRQVAQPRIINCDLGIEAVGWLGGLIVWFAP